MRTSSYKPSRLKCSHKIQIEGSNASLCIPAHPSPSSNHATRLRLSSLQKLHVLFRVGLLNIALSNFLHHEVGIDVDFLAKLAVGDAPFAANGEDTDGRFGVDEGVDSLRDIGQSELVGCLR
jgi:hypothetical protein